MTTLLLLSIGLLLIATAEKRPALPPEQKGVFDVRNGWKYYKADVAKLAINRLIAMRALPTEQANMMLLVPDPQGLAVGSEDWGAYAALLGLHDQGFDLWVPTNFHLPVATPMPAMFLPPGERPPSDTFAMLIAASDQWPPPPMP